MGETLIINVEISTMVLPFVLVAGRWHVIVNWAIGMKAGELLTLRPLNDKEVAWLKPRLEDAYFEIFATLFPADHNVTNGGVIPEDDDG